MLRHRNPIALVAACLLAVGCGSGGGQALPTVVPTPSTVPHVTPAPPSTIGSTAPASPATSTPRGSVTTVPGPRLSPGGPWKQVDGVPGITTPGLFYELIPKLWLYLPTTEDIAHNIVWTFTEHDREIIEAYVQAQSVYFHAIESTPIDLDDPAWKKFFVRGGATSADLVARKARGEVGDLDLGVVLRPQVIGDERTESTAIVFDCLLDGGVFRTPDGSLAAGSTLGIRPAGVGFRMVFAGGSWRASQIGRQPEACQ